MLRQRRLHFSQEILDLGERQPMGGGQQLEPVTDGPVKGVRVSSGNPDRGMRTLDGLWRSGGLGKAPMLTVMLVVAGPQLEHRIQRLAQVLSATLLRQAPEHAIELVLEGPAGQPEL